VDWCFRQFVGRTGVHHRHHLLRDLRSDVALRLRAAWSTSVNAAWSCGLGIGDTFSALLNRGVPSAQP
jgi:hypothetical protein